MGLNLMLFWAVQEDSRKNTVRDLIIAQNIYDKSTNVIVVNFRSSVMKQKKKKKYIADSTATKQNN